MKKIQAHLDIKTLALLMLAFLLLIAFMEALLRIDAFSSRLATPSFGSEQHQFELQVARIKAVYQRQSSIDCIFIGDSLTWLDMNPVKFSEGYASVTGEEITCFNFGVAALPASGVSKVTDILVREYHPKLIVYGLHANSIVVARGNEDAEMVLDSPWVKYMSGEFNLAGWLYENSYFFRYLNVMNQLMQFDQDGLVNELGTLPHQLLGNDSKNGQRIDIHIPPSRSNDADVNGFKKYYEYQVYPENLSGIQDIARMADQDTTVVMVMMPVNKSFYGFFKNGEQDYLEITKIIRHTLAGTDSSLLDANSQYQLPDSAWWDYSHLNFDGANQLSVWLGEQVGKGLLNGQLHD